MGFVIEHHGIKGMKWGVHKQKQLDRANRVAAGKGSTLDKLRVYGNVSLFDLIKTRKAKSVAAGQAAMLHNQKKRILSGNATNWDKLDRALNTPMHQLRKGQSATNVSQKPKPVKSK